MRKFSLPGIAPILILVLIFVTLTASGPKCCAICDSIPYHAPCLVNLATGEVGELAVYEPHPFKSGELNEFQQGEAFSFMNVVGATGYRDGVSYAVDITIPADENEYDEQLFCRSCRKIISQHGETGFLLMDLWAPENPIILRLDAVGIQTVRCYEIQTKRKANGIEIIVKGCLHIDDHVIAE